VPYNCSRLFEGFALIAQELCFDFLPRGASTEALVRIW
jgi:hypothetical protein